MPSLAVKPSSPTLNFAPRPSSGFFRRMSVVHHLPPGWLLDHLSFINKVNYQIQQHREPSCSRNHSTSSVDLGSLQMDATSPSGAPTTCSAPDSTAVPANEIITQNYAFRPELFNVTKPYIIHKECQQSGQNEDLVTGAKQDVSISVGKKRKRSLAFNQGELDAMEHHTKIRELVLGGSSQLIQEGLKSGVLCPIVETQHGNSGRVPLPLDACNLSELCEMAKHLPSLEDMHLQTLPLAEDDMSVIELDLSSQVIENNANFSRMINLMGQKYLLPPNSSFLLSDISCMQPLLNCSKTFDVIVIDPPWQNKSVKRSNRYSCLSPQQIKHMPVPKLAAADCLIVTWVTNRQKHLCFVKEELYPSWSVEVIAEWYWVKITRSGEFVFPLDSPHKKPYECLVLGRFREKTALVLRSTERLHQARRAVFGTVCSEFTARLDELGQRSPQVSARGLFHCSGVWTLTLKLCCLYPAPSDSCLLGPASACRHINFYTNQCA
ncbi:N(6)-adenine-specific methyltransferase METTL4-like isoform X1 [Microtus oregoni]|uniref:N(6)-adenine-specific methyltransferase METTL4-like isoform X1 n=2 Tax=Microtus oregoni TaxID=111838 RepID=UPI001BB1FD38|nr:N(6)-adenine-specific methyltransferase METTL4-like isoform X1 [Microtus oregoni]XP_041524309.1 N(6)-adenine-specific methyltransferase METTL4-like isoform X1 [Microtus oregoni]